MTPPFGPLSGGTPVVLFGRHLDAGSRVEVMIGDNPCLVREVLLFQLCFTHPISFNATDTSISIRAAFAK